MGTADLAGPGPAHRRKCYTRRLPGTQVGEKSTCRGPVGAQLVLRGRSASRQASLPHLSLPSHHHICPCCASCCSCLLPLPWCAAGSKFHRCSVLCARHPFPYPCPCGNGAMSSPGCTQSLQVAVGPLARSLNLPSLTPSPLLFFYVTPSHALLPTSSHLAEPPSRVFELVTFRGLVVHRLCRVAHWACVVGAARARVAVWQAIGLAIGT